MTSVNTGLNPYAQMGSAYARAAAPQPSLIDAIVAANSGDQPDINAATNLTLSDAARAQLSSASTMKDFSAVTADARSALDSLYTTAKVKGPVGDNGETTIDLSSFDRRSLFAIATNNGGKFTPDEQKVASTELGNRFNDAMAPAAATSKLTGDFSPVYKAALDYLDGASSEEKATATWSAQRAAVLKGVQATQQNPTTAPPELRTIRSLPTSRKMPMVAQRQPRIFRPSPRTSAPRSTRRRRLPPPPGSPLSNPTSVRLTINRWRRSRSIRTACSRSRKALPPSKRWIRVTAPASWLR
jgi:hypothetical protein